MIFDTAITDELLATTRAVRKRLDFDRPVPREIILECLQLAMQAPNGGNRQEWRWLVIDDTSLKAELAGLYSAAAEDYFAPIAAVEGHRQDAQTERNYESWRWLVDHLQMAPALVIPCVEARLEPDPAFGRMAAYFGSIFPAIWSFQLALRSRGLGSTLTTLHLARARQAAELFSIPDGVEQIALLPVAYTKGLDFRPAERPPAATITHWNGW